MQILNLALIQIQSPHVDLKTTPNSPFTAWNLLNTKIREPSLHISECPLGTLKKALTTHLKRSTYTPQKDIPIDLSEYSLYFFSGTL